LSKTKGERDVTGQFCFFARFQHRTLFHSVPVMAGLPLQHTNPAQLGGNKPILLQLEEHYTKRVDDDVLKLVDSFADITRVTEVTISASSGMTKIGSMW
jgi:hypothetical protein